MSEHMEEQRDVQCPHESTCPRVLRVQAERDFSHAQATDMQRQLDECRHSKNQFQRTE